MSPYALQLLHLGTELGSHLILVPEDIVVRIVLNGASAADCFIRERIVPEMPQMHEGQLSNSIGNRHGGEMGDPLAAKKFD